MKPKFSTNRISLLITSSMVLWGGAVWADGPRVDIQSPRDGDTFTAPATIQICADAREYGGTVVSVQFFANGNSIGVVTSANYSQFCFVWSNVVAGSYTLTALATDNVGATALSYPVSIQVNGSGTNQSLQVQIQSPRNGDTFTAPANVQICADARENNGTVVSVQFFANNTNFIGIVTSGTNNQFCFVWSNVVAGSYSLTALATDNAGATALSSPVSIQVNPAATNQLQVSIQNPHNGDTFTAPTNIQVCADAKENNGTVVSVQFFADTNFIGIVTSGNNNQFCFVWSNVVAGSYTLTAMATDNVGATALSSPVVIQVNPAATNQSLQVSIQNPHNGDTFTAPTNIQICADAKANNATVVSVQFFANTNFIGIVTSGNNNQFCFVWSNVVAGSYSLTALATDNLGATALSSPVVIQVNPAGTNQPPQVSIQNPRDGDTFNAPANVLICADATDPDGTVASVQFFANSNSLGVVTNGNNNQFCIIASNLLAGSYTLTALATDDGGASTLSAPVSIQVISGVTNTNALPEVTIRASDAVASEGTNFLSWRTTYSTGGSWSWGSGSSWNWGHSSGGSWGGTNSIPGTNTATFVVRRDDGTNADLNVFYNVSGTASNGVDFQFLPGVVTIPAGSNSAQILVVPIEEDSTNDQEIATVILTLQTNAAYVIGRRSAAEAIIVEEGAERPPTCRLSDNSFHLCLLGTNGFCFSIESSTDLVNWQGICTNIVTDGAIHFADPDARQFGFQFYRALPQANPPPN